MANITDYLNRIKSAVYGKEVRGAIHDAIKQVYDDASVNHDNANMEVKMARGTYNTLNDRLNKMDEIQTQTNAQLSQNIKPVISFCFDDGYAEDDLTASIFKEFGMTCSFALVTDYTINRRTMDVYRKYQNEGFSINCHTCEHTNLSTTGVSDATARWEIVESKRKMNSYGFSANGLVASNSVIPDRFMEYVRRNYNYAFTQYWGVVNTSNTGYITNKNQDLHKLGRVSLTHNSLDTIKSTIDKCVANNGILFFYDHRTGYDDGTSHVTEQKLRDILTYLKSLVDSNKVLVKNNDDAISYYFNIQLDNYVDCRTKSNLAVPLNRYNRTDLANDTWFFSLHNNDAGETITKVDDGTIEIKYPSGISALKENSLQLKVDLTEIDMKDNENQTIVVSFDVWSDADITTVATANARFYRVGGAFDTTHTSDKVTINSKKQRVSLVATILNKDETYEYVQCYLRITNETLISSATNIYVSNAKIAFTSNVDTVVGVPKTLAEYGDSHAKTLDQGFQHANKQWIHYQCRTFAYNTFKSTTDPSGTVEILKTGIYYVFVQGFYKVTGADSDSRILLRVMPSTNASDLESRLISYYNGSNDVVNINGGQALFLKEGELLTVDVYFDSTSGTIYQLEDPQIKMSLINEVY